MNPPFRTIDDVLRHMRPLVAFGTLIIIPCWDTSIGGIYFPLVDSGNLKPHMPPAWNIQAIRLDSSEESLSILLSPRLR